MTDTDSDSEDFVSTKEYAIIVGELTKIWMQIGGNGTNMDVLRKILSCEDMNEKMRIYAAFIHGYEFANQRLADAEEGDKS